MLSTFTVYACESLQCNRNYTEGIVLWQDSTNMTLANGAIYDEATD